MSAYFLFILCVWFLFNKDPNINHPFVKNHTRIALTLHVIFLVMLWVMSFSFLDGIHLLWISVNTLITMWLSFIILAALIFWAIKAHKGETLSFGEIFEAGWANKKLLQKESSVNIDEENIALLIITHIPFLGFILYGKHKKLPHIHDIMTLNIWVSLLISILYISGFASLANVWLLVYVIWASFVSLRLIATKEISTLNLSSIPSGNELYIHIRTLISYAFHLLKSNKKFQSYATLYSENARTYTVGIQKHREHISKMPLAKIPHVLFYIPFVNLLWVFFLNSQQRYHIYNGFVITLFYILALWVFGMNTKVVLLLLFPICFGIWYLWYNGYMMPLISDIWKTLGTIWYWITHVFHRGKQLHKTVKEEKIVIKNTKKEEN